MGLSQNLFLFFMFLFKGCNTSATSHEQTFNCHDEESSALLQFKQSFTVDASASVSDGAYPKVSSWKPAQGGNITCCCTWDGVECGEETGHVIGLDLSSSCLYGSINSNSSLFRLVHLQRLNLSDNHFNYSQVPTSIRNFPSLTHLDLSNSVFSGRVPSQLSQLVKLSTLDLSVNIDPSSEEGLLKLDGSNFRSLVQNLTSLQKLHLSYINISSPIPHSMANLSFLTSLLLRDCGIFDEFPVRIFKLQNLKILSVRFNQNLIGHVPEFNRSSPLISLLLASTSFSGNLPSTIEKLDSLNELDVSGCNLSGVIPFSLGNLKQLNYLDLSKNRFTGPIPASLANLTQLTFLSLSMNNFVGGPLSWVVKQTKLTVLDLASINLIGDIPSSLENLTQLTDLDLSGNQLTGPIPSWVGNLSRLVYLDLGFNKLNSSIPESLFTLRDLKFLFLAVNGLTGVVDVFKVQNVTDLHLGGNKLDVITESRTMNTTVLPMFRSLGLGSCNIKEFPSFLRYQQNLLWLNLNSNKLQGKVPKWMWNTSTQTMEFLSLAVNFLTGFDQTSPVILPWVNLKVLWLNSNMLYGPVPIPPSNIIYYTIGDNRFVGEIPPFISNLSILQYLDLSNNKLSGMLPQCLGNISDDLRVLDLRNNSFQGILPQVYTSNLRIFDVSNNQLQGQLPRSLENCSMLESLVLSNNEFNDDFPFWLGMLPELKLLAMNHNGFYGVIQNTKKNLHFPELRILDISYNNFRGEFPSEYIFTGNAMRGIAQSQPTYMDTRSEINVSGATSIVYEFSIMITNKGVERYYEYIREDLGVIDISSNNFEGNFPEFIRNLKGLRFLNISHNSFTGTIPSDLGNLTMLEALDLSQNQLSGEIPQQLAQLTTLAYFNVSYNHLTGSVPQGPQFQTFDSISFEGNPGLCGGQLPKKCGNSMTPAPLPPSSTEEDDSGSGIAFDWKFVLAGFGSGFVVGVVLADMVIARKRELFLEIVGMLIKLIKRIRIKRLRMCLY